MKILKRLFFIIFIIGFIFSIANGTILTASVSQKNLSIGETFNLIIDAQSSQSNLKSPDLNPLQKNFTILETAQNQSLNIVNDKITRSNQWIISLIPKRTGTLVIPSIHLGENKTKPIRIHVANLKTEKNNGRQAIFLEATVEPERPYVNSELIYQLRIYYDVNLNSATIIPPQGKNILIQQAGEDQTYQTIIKNKKYQVYQRNFILIPQKAGEISLSPAIFRGQISGTSSNPTYGNFYNLNVKPIELIAPSIKVTVKPIPENFINKWWLPANQVQLSEHWSQTTNKVKVGTPITRTITLTAVGTLASQLPPINVKNTPFYNVYANQPQFKNSIVNGHLIGEKQEKFVYIPTQTDGFTLPAISIEWWNVQTKKFETAALPTRTFHVIAAETTQTIKNSSITSEKFNKSTAHSPLTTQSTDWMYIAALFISLWLLTAMGWWLSHRKKKLNFTQLNAKFDKNLLKKACLNNDAIATKIALIAWGQQKFKKYDKLKNLEDIQGKINCPKFIDEIQLLQEKLYSNSKKTWSGEKLWYCVRKYKITKSKRSHNKNILPDLNPE